MEKAFTAEELAQLRKSPYIKSSFAQRIHFTVVFKEEFWEWYSNGEIPNEIMRLMGIDPDILGLGRIKGIMKRIRDQAATGTGFTEGHQWQVKNAPADESQPVSKRLKRLEHEIA